MRVIYLQNNCYIPNLSYLFFSQGLSWTVHLCYLLTLKSHQIGSSMRGSAAVLLVWSLSVVTAALFTHTCFSKASITWTPQFRQVMQGMALCHLVLQVRLLYRDREVNAQSLTTIFETSLGSLGKS